MGAATLTPPNLDNPRTDAVILPPPTGCLRIGGLPLHHWDFGRPGGGPSFYFQSQLHGNETHGTPVLYRLIELLAALPRNAVTGRVRVVPRANPHAWQAYLYTRQGTYETRTGINWNRICDWRGVAEEIAAEGEGTAGAIIAARRARAATLQEQLSLGLLQLSWDHDHIVDVHTPDRGVEHLYCDSLTPEVPRFEIPNVIEFGAKRGPSFDEAHLTLAAILGLRRQSVTLELPSVGAVEAALVEDWAARLFNELLRRGVLQGPARERAGAPGSDALRRGQMRDFRSERGGLPVLRATLGEDLPAGEPLMDILPFDPTATATEVLISERRCVPLCLRQDKLVPPGVWAIRVLEL
jgi:predicted deacylase